MIKIKVTYERLLNDGELMTLAILSELQKSETLNTITAMHIVINCMYDDEEERYLTKQEAAGYLKSIQIDDVMDLLGKTAEQIEDLVRLLPFEKFVDDIS